MRNLFLFLCFFLIFNFGFSQKNEKLDSLFTVLYEDGRFNGNVLIAEKGEIIFQKSYGFANFNSKEKLNDSTVFDLASVSKEFTAVAMQLLQRQGKIDFEASIAQYIPELDYYKDVQVKHLIYHTSGLPDFMQLLPSYWNPKIKARNIDFVELFKEHQPEPVFRPGENFQYSNTGYALLGLIIERVSGKSFADFLSEHIFNPLQMKNTRVYRNFYDQWEIPNYALGHISDSLGGKIAVDDLAPTNFRHYLDGIVGAGQIKSTTEDLLKWDQALYENKLFSEEEKEFLFAPAKTNEGRSIPYAFGWVVKNQDPFGNILYHPGRWAGYVNHFERDIDAQKTIIILQNNDLEKTITPKNEVRNILYEIQVVNPHQDILKKYAGFYAHEDNSFTLKYQDQRLYYVSPSGNEFEMQALSSDKFMISQYLFDTYFHFSNSNSEETTVILKPEMGISREYMRQK